MNEHFDNLDHQDWKTIVIRKNPKKNIENSKKKVDNTR